MHCIKCENEVYGLLIQGHCRSCAEEKIINHDRILTDLENSNNHVDELLSELRRLSIRNQSLQVRSRVKTANPTSERNVKLTEEEYTEFINKLGKFRDSDLAREYGVSDSYVCRKRQRLGIATFANNEELWEKIDPVIFSKSIRAVAADFGIDRGRIERRRKKLMAEREAVPQL